MVTLHFLILYFSRFEVSMNILLSQRFVSFHLIFVTENSDKNQPLSLQFKHKHLGELIFTGVYGLKAITESVLDRLQSAVLPNSVCGSLYHRFVPLQMSQFKTCLKIESQLLQVKRWQRGSILVSGCNHINIYFIKLVLEIIQHYSPIHPKVIKIIFLLVPHYIQILGQIFIMIQLIY